MARPNSMPPPPQHWFSQEPLTPPPPTFIESVAVLAASPYFMVAVVLIVLQLAIRFYGHLLARVFGGLCAWVTAPRAVIIVDTKGRPLNIEMPASSAPEEALPAEEGARGAQQQRPAPPGPNSRPPQYC